MSLRVRLLVGFCLCALLVGLLHGALSRWGVSGLSLEVGGQTFTLQAPGWLRLLGLLPLLWLLGSGSLVDLSRTQQALSLIVRGLLLSGLVLALARPAMIYEERRVCSVFAVDVSRSISDDQLAQARRVVQAAWRARGEHEMRLLTFARSPLAVDLDPAKSEVPALARHRGPGDGEQSDLQAALQHAQGLFPTACLRRLVLISDGNETHGDLLAEANRQAARGVPIHVWPLPPRRDPEVLVRDLRAPKEVRMGAPFDLGAEVHSTHAQRVTLTLYKDDFVNGLDGRRQVELLPGRNPVSFKSLVREAGTVRYRLVLTGAAKDTFAQNNSTTALLPVLGRPRVLYVEGEPEHAGPLKAALEAEKIDVEVRGPHGVPATPAALAAFDLLFVSDTPAVYMGPGQMAAIDAYVRDLGGGFIMTGGPNAFGAGGYQNTLIERILPVRFDGEKKQDQPSLALMLCIDRSGSMTGLKLELAKDAAKASAEILDRADLIGVVAFDSSAQVLVRLQRAANRLRILSDIARLSSGGGTSIRPALEEAYSQLRLAEAKVKHVILLSDGQSSFAGIPQLVDEMAQAGITVTAVGVGSGADRTLLQMIAERGGGRFYFTEDPQSIPRIFTKETTQVARSALVEEAVRVQVAKRGSAVAGIDWSAAPALAGYVSVKSKPGSETLLVSHHGEPIFSQWRHGLGQTAAFTSDVKSRWAGAWLRWPGYTQFWAQVVREVMRHRLHRAFEMQAGLQHGIVTVTVDALDRTDRFINGLSSTVTLLDPAIVGRKRTYPLPQTAAGRYETAFPLPFHGALLLRASHRSDGKLVAEDIAALSAPVSEEVAQLRPDPERLARAAAASHGLVNPSPDRVFDARGESIRGRRAIWPRVLFAVIALLLLDVLLRRVRLLGWRRSHRPVKNRS